MALLLGLWALAQPLFAEPRINEFLAVNNRGLADGDEEATDWIDQKIGEISTTKHGRTEKNNRRFWIKVAKNQSKNFDDVFVAEQKMLA